MSAEEVDIEQLKATRKDLEAKVNAQAQVVCDLKAKSPVDKEALGQEVATLRGLKEKLKAAIKAYTSQFESEKADINREAVENLLKRRFFYAQAFEIYNGASGLFDLGPPGCAVQAALVSLWRQMFVVEEDNYELDCSILTPSTVLEASGHTAKFCDFMVSDKKGLNFVRADHLLEEWIEARLDEGPSTDEEDELQKMRARADELDKDELYATLQKYYRPTSTGKGKKKKAPKETTFDDEWCPPVEFNLMFATGLGPSGAQKAFLRPETAQGMFVNFKRLVDFSGGRLPFGAAQIGKAFRNEISPGQGLLRLREFLLAEVEYFVHPSQTTHPRFKDIKDAKMRLFSRDAQLGDRRILELTAGEAVEQGLLNSQNLAYYMSRTWQFLTRAGANPAMLRMRQHLPNEMAHYARDCWDAEILTSYGWVECVGHADRAAFDLGAHSKGSGTRLDVYDSWKESDWKQEKRVEAQLNAGKMGKVLRKRMAATKTRCLELAANEPAEALKLEAALAADGKATLSMPDGEGDVELTREMISFKEVTVTIKGESVVPQVIEPAFGLGRIMYAIFEHSFRQREVQDETEKRHFLSLPALVAPTKFSVLPLLASNEWQCEMCHDVRRKLNAIGASAKVDTGNENIGRRYARTDEIGIPYGITVDNDSQADNSVTLRERDSTKQVRIVMKDGALEAVCADLLRGDPWDDVVKKHNLPEFVAK